MKKRILCLNSRGGAENGHFNLNQGASVKFAKKKKKKNVFFWKLTENMVEEKKNGFFYLFGNPKEMRNFTKGDPPPSLSQN